MYYYRKASTGPRLKIVSGYAVTRTQSGFRPQRIYLGFRFACFTVFEAIYTLPEPRTFELDETVRKWGGTTKSKTNKASPMTQYVPSSTRSEIVW